MTSSGVLPKLFTFSFFLVLFEGLPVSSSGDLFPVFVQLPVSLIQEDALWSTLVHSDPGHRAWPPLSFGVHQSLWVCLLYPFDLLDLML